MGFDSSFSCYDDYNIEMIDLGGKFAWGHEMIYYRTHNKDKKEAKLPYKQKQTQKDRKALHVLIMISDLESISFVSAMPIWDLTLPFLVMMTIILK